MTPPTAYPEYYVTPLGHGARQTPSGQDRNQKFLAMATTR